MHVLEVVLKYKDLDDAFEIPADMVGIGKGQTYYIQTYGCQE